MTESKQLYFIPIIARALQVDDTKRAMEEAFDEIKDLGKQEEYHEGFQQFLEFINTALKPSEEESEKKAQALRYAIYRLIHDLATDKFKGNEELKETLLNELKDVPEWYTEYERIKKEAETFLAAETAIEVEILKGDQKIGSFIDSPEPAFIHAVTPGKYMIRFSNGRTLWEGDLTKEDLIWAFAFPNRNLSLAAETEDSKKNPTRTISLLDGEIIIQVFAGLETGQISVESGKGA